MSNDIETMIEWYGMEDPRIVYSNVESYEDMLRTNIAHLQGRMKRSLTYVDPVLTDDMIPFIHSLIRLHTEFGFFTIDSQPSLCEDSLLRNTNIPYRLEQKPYVCGYIHKQYLDGLLERLQCPELQGIVSYHIQNYDGDFVETNYEYPRSVVVTREIINNDEISDFTYVHKGYDPSILEQSEDDYPIIYDMFIDECVFVSMFIDEFCTEYDLLDLLLCDE